MSQDPADLGPSWFRVPEPALAPARGLHAPRYRRVRRDRIDLRVWQWPILDGRRHIRSRDVICAGMYRACSTWQYEVVGHLVELHWHGQRMGYVSGEAYRAAGHPTPTHWRSGQRVAWRVLKSHEGHREFSRALATGQAVAVYAFRDIRDVVCSLMHKRGATFRQLLRQGMIHQILANDRFWRAQPRVLVQRYEEMVADPVTAVVHLARHLGLGVTRRQAIEIADEYSLESNLTRIEALRQQMVEAGIDLTAARNLQIYDPVTLLHWNHVRPGGSGSWQTDLSHREVAVLVSMCAGWLEANDYDPHAGSWSQREVIRHDRFSSVQNGMDLALGVAATVLRWVKGSCPLAARLVKQLLGITRSAPGSELAWPLIDASKGAMRHLRPVSGNASGQSIPIDNGQTAMLAPCSAR